MHMHNVQPLAFSYLRLSTPEQRRGGGRQRQLALAEQYAAKHALRLDPRSFEDLGVSGFRGDNLTTGQLGRVLHAAKTGTIPAGSYLLIESLDRISRDKARRAVRTLEDLCDAGLVVVTLADERVYDKETLDNDPTATMFALVVAMRAHDESATKSKRRGAAWQQGRDQAERFKRPITAQAPGWLELPKEDRRAFRPISEHVAIVKRIYSEYLGGAGTHAIAAALNAEGVPCFGRARQWHRSYVVKILENPAVCGEFTPHVVQKEEGKKTRRPQITIQGYFPTIIDRLTFERVQDMRRDKRAPSGRNGRRSVSHVLAGLARCPRCGGAMVRVNKGSGPKAGKPRLVCYRARNKAGCFAPGVRLDVVEAAVLGVLPELVQGGRPATSWQAQDSIKRMEEEKTKIEERLQWFIDALTKDGTSADRARERIANWPSLGAEIRKLEDRLQETTKWLEDVRGLESRHSSESVAPILTELHGEINRPQPDIVQINAILRRLIDRVKVDFDRGELRFIWHGLATTQRLPLPAIKTGSVR